MCINGPAPLKGLPYAGASPSTSQPLGLLTRISPPATHAVALLPPSLLSLSLPPSFLCPAAVEPPRFSHTTVSTHTPEAARCPTIFTIHYPSFRPSLHKVDVSRGALQLPGIWSISMSSLRTSSTALSHEDLHIRSSHEKGSHFPAPSICTPPVSPRGSLFCRSFSIWAGSPSRAAPHGGLRSPPATHTLQQPGESQVNSRRAPSDGRRRKKKAAHAHSSGYLIDAIHWKVAMDANVAMDEKVGLPRACSRWAAPCRG